VRALRTLALPQVTAQALREHRKAQLETRLRVFEEAGISCRIHDRRRTHATMLLR